MWPWHHCPTPILLEGPWGPLLLTTLKLCLVCVCVGGGWSPGKKGNQAKRENNKPRIGDCNSGSKHPPAPWGGSEGFSCPPIPDFPLPLPNISTAGQEAPALRWKGRRGCLTWSQGVSEKPGLGRLRE